MPDLKTLELVLTVFRVLSHKVRTPLSVISNDLSYLQTILDKDECQRSIERCRQISDFFRPAQALITEQVKNFDLLPVLQEIFRGRCRLNEDVRISAGYSNLKQILIWLDELFKISAISFSPPRDILFETDNSFNSDGTKLTSVAEIFSSDAGDQNIVPLLIDAVLLSSGTEVYSGKGNTFFLRFP